MGDLFGGLLLGEVGLGEEVLGLVGFGLDAGLGPGISRVVVFVEGGCLVVERLQLGLGGLGHGRSGLLDVVGGRLERVRAVLIPEGVDGHLPVTGAVGAGRELAARGIGEAELDAHGLVHPVVGSEFGAEGCLGVGVAGIVAVVGPGDGLHIGSQVAIVGREVKSHELAIAADGCVPTALGNSRRAQPGGHGGEVGSLERLVLDTRAGARLVGGREARGGAVHRHGLKAVGAGIHVGNKAAIGLEVGLAIAAGKRLAVGHEGVGLLKGVQIGGLDLDGDVLEACDLVVLHLVGLAVDGHLAPVPRDGLAIGRGEGLAVGRPGGQIELGAVLGLDDGGALVAAAVQAVVGGGAGHHVKGALVGLFTAVELVGARRATGVVHALVGPVLGPGERRVAIGVFVGRGGGGVLFVVGGLQGIVHGGLDGVGRICCVGHHVHIGGLRVDYLRGDAHSLLRSVNRLFDIRGAFRGYSVLRNSDRRNLVTGYAHLN